MLSGLNHLTLAVTDVQRSLAFYHELLQFKLDATWDDGAYLSLPGVWLCVSLDPSRQPTVDYTHYAFTVGAPYFAAFVARLRAAGVVEWRDNHSEGASFYFRDPDGHQLEAHVGDLASRLQACRAKPYAGMKFYP